MVGDGPDRAAAERHALDLKVAEDVVFLGKVKNPIEPLLISDLLVLPSETESFGLGLGSLRRRGARDFDRRGRAARSQPARQNRHAPPVGDVEGMAKDALHVLDSAQFPSFHEAALQQAESFHIHKILPQYEALYRKALATPSS